MKLLFDENLSRKLVARLAELYPDSVHVAEVGLLESPDLEIWEFAKAEGFMIVTTDSDFTNLQQPKGRLRRWRGSAAGGTQRAMGSGYFGERPSESRNSPPIPNSLSSFSIAIKVRAC